MMPFVEFPFAPFAGLVFAIIAFVVAFAPFIVLWIVADDRGASKLHVLWGFLGWLGVVIGLLIMLSAPRPATSAPRVAHARLVCSECGAPLPDGARYCARCGVALAGSQRAGRL